MTNIIDINIGSVDIDHIYVAEYSMIQKAFNICTIKEAMFYNLQSITRGINTGYQVIAVGTREECVEVCNIVDEKFRGRIEDGNEN